jgi:hypothetical protein
MSLCERCAHVRVVTSGRGSRFLLCELSKERPEFPKYPPQPVARCAGFTEREPERSGPPAGRETR